MSVLGPCRLNNGRCIDVLFQPSQREILAQSPPVHVSVTLLGSENYKDAFHYAEDTLSQVQ